MEHFHMRRCEAAIANFDPMTESVYGLGDDFERMTLESIEKNEPNQFTRFALLVAPSRFGFDVSTFVFNEENRDAVGGLVRQLAWAMRACAFISLTAQHVAGVHCGSIVTEHRSMAPRRRLLTFSEGSYRWVIAPAPRPEPRIFEPSASEIALAETDLRPSVQEIERLTRADETASVERATSTLASMTDLLARLTKGGVA